MSSPLAQLGLHHLRALDVLLSTGHVTRAAERLGLSQSALSHTLAELRRVLDDPLLVRGPGGMVLTPRAEALGPPLRRALADLERALGGEARFDPGTARRRFVLSMGDSFAVLLLPTLVRLVGEQAPGVDLLVRPPPEGRATLGIEHHDADLALDVRPPDLPGLRTRALFEDGFSCLVRADHPAVGEILDLATWLSLPHALVSPVGEGPGIVDQVLAARGLERRVALRVPFFMAAPLAVASSDLVLTLPTRIAHRLASQAPLRILPPPLPLPTYTSSLVWPARLHEDPAHRWLRALVVQAAG